MATVVSQSGLREGSGLSLTARLAIVLAVLFAEKFCLNFLVDFAAAQAAGGLGVIVRVVQHYGFRFALAAGGALALFAWVREDPIRAALEEDVRRDPLRLRWLAVHALFVMGLAPLTYYLYGRPRPLPFALDVSLWLLFALGAVVALVAALARLEIWVRSARALGMLWVYATAIGAASVGAYQLSQGLWAPTARVTFSIVVAILRSLLPGLTADPHNLIISTPGFAIEVSEVCSGLEGVGLMLGFCTVWLLWMRRQFLFPRALVIIPIGVALILALNVLRITVLVLIGAVGYPEVAIYGFHSVAGWMAFNGAAVFIALMSRRSRWLNPNLETVDASHPSTGENPTAAYLLPLLGILTAGLLAHAVSRGFETLYGLRLVVAGAALWYYRDTLRRLDWRAGGWGLGAGLLVAALWFPAAAWLTPPSGMPEALASMSAPERTLWIAVRTLGSVVLVPIAEELAYRGFLLRRIASEDFEAAPFAHVGWKALLISSVVFGIGHGALWLPGIAAGLLYGAVVMRTGRIGEAVLAHATTNALLSAAVIGFGQWQLW